MDVMGHNCLARQNPRRAFAWAAFAALFVQMVVLHRLLGITRTPLWNAGHVLAANVHAVLIYAADSMILLIPVCLRTRRWRWLQWGTLSLFTLWGAAQFMYMPTYGDLMPPSSFVLWGNLDSMVISSAMSNWAKRDWLFILPWALLVCVDVCWLRHLPERTSGDCRHRPRAWVMLLAGLFLHGVANAVSYAAYWHHGMSLTQFLDGNYTHVKVKHAAYLADNGLLGYWTYCVAVAVAQHHSITDAECALVEAHLSGLPHYEDNIYASGKQNLILVIVESLNSWVVDFRVDGREVTPVLNALCADTASIVGLHMQRQVKNGGSSDAHFMYNTGLLPLEQRAVAMVYGDSAYPTLLQAIHCDNTIHVCGDPSALWNTEITSRTYGYRSFHGGNEVKPRLRADLWQIDKSILELADGYLRRLSQPFVAQVVTLGMHEPYNRTDVPETWIGRSGKYTVAVRNYLERVAVFDRELGYFLRRLKRAGLYDNSLIVVVSDHDDPVDHVPEGRRMIAPDGGECLLLVLNSGQGRRINEPFGQIDVFPTLLDLMGCNDYQWKGLGNSVMRGVDGTVALSPYNTVGSGGQLQRKLQAWEVSRLMITSRWFDNHPMPRHPRR